MLLAVADGRWPGLIHAGPIPHVRADIDANMQTTARCIAFADDVVSQNLDTRSVAEYPGMYSDPGKSPIISLCDVNRIV